MFNFKNDYSYMACSEVLESLLKYQDECFGVYGLDSHSLHAKELIQKEIGNKNVDIHFFVGGTITNKTFISHALRPYEAVISSSAGHINVHETGAIESTGHKVLTVNHVEGKISVKCINECVLSHTDEHMVLPKMVYISQTTEYGTIYSVLELEEIYKYCKENGLYFFIDGARIANALALGISLSDIANNCDAFYIGGTKNGALLGEALVICNDKLKESFRYSIKQNGGMYSKGYVAGIQFETLFNDNLYLKLALNANECAKYLASELVKRGLKMQLDCVTNQLFPIVDNCLYEKLKETVLFELWEDLKDCKVIRFVCSYKTKMEEIDLFLQHLDQILN